MFGGYMGTSLEPAVTSMSLVFESMAWASLGLHGQAYMVGQQVSGTTVGSAPGTLGGCLILGQARSLVSGSWPGG